MTSEKPVFTVRPAVSQDLLGIYNLFVQMDASHAEALPFMYRASDVDEWPEHHLEEYLVREDSTILVGVVGETVVGVAYGVIEAAPPLPFLVARRYAYLRVVSVDAAYRRRGIGNALLEAVQAWAVLRGVESIELTVADFNTGAMDLYERAGYVPVSRRMVKRLDEPSSNP